MIKTNKLSQLLLLGFLLIGMNSCDDFIFGNIKIDDKENPLIQKKTPRSGAEIYYGSEQGQHKLPVNKNANIKNNDPNGAFANWYTCLVMFKEGHSHHGGKMHGNPVYTRAAWRQEQFAEIRNNELGIPEIEFDQKSILTFVEEERGAKAPNYFRIIGGTSKLWAMCLYFYDKEGNFLNDSILKYSDEYQIFFSISDIDNHNKPYKVMDVRYRKEMPEVGVIEGTEAECFKNKNSFEERRVLTPKILEYIYRDTWTHQDMADGVRDFFNIKLLPPLDHKSYDKATEEDVDCIGLKGHFKFDLAKDEKELDERPWPLKLSDKSFKKEYTRPTFLLPKFYLAVRVMKCKKGKKATVETQSSENRTTKCAPFYEPNAASEWTEIIRFNIPIKIYSSSFDSDPTNIDPYEPFYYHVGREIGLNPEDAFETIFSSSGNGGLGFDSWFL